jgi:demethylmenaquinone methyltransferase/2-methoxy-6-polyprenyl-1,4-benzoquinol methylase
LTNEHRSGSPAVKSMFAAIAGRYDLLNRLLSMGTDVRWRRELAAEVTPGSANPILDLATGTGDVALTLSREVAGENPIIGADFAMPMLQVAREKVSRDGTDRIRLSGADALNLPFAEGSFSAVTISFGLRNLPHRVHAMGEMNRVLAPGGRLIVLEFSKVQSPVIGPLFRFYFHKVLPWLGGMISGHPGAYNYLPRSVDDFPDPLELGQEMFTAGFAEVRYRPLTFGIAYLHVAEKQG